MDDREILRRRRGNSDVGNPFHGRRKRREKRERKMAERISKLRTMGPVPGIDGVECFKRGDARPFHHSHQIDAGIGDSPGAVREANQGKHRARSPDFGVIGAGGFERRERKDDVADRARPDQQTSVTG